METWWSSLEIIQKVMWCIAIGTSFIFLIQSIMTFLGMDSDGGLDADADPNDSYPFQLFSFRNLINFLLGFSWSAVVFYHTFNNLIVLTLLSTFFGLFIITVIMFIFYQLSKMEQSGNIAIEETVGLNGNVYLVIAGHRQQQGKVQLSVRGSIREYNAITDGETIKTGELIVVEKVLEGNILLVKKLN